MSLWQTLYRAATTLSLPGLHVLLARREAAGKEDADRLHERFGYPGLPRPAGKLVWLHAASVGEAVSTLLLVEKLGQQKPDAHFLITTGTVTSARILSTRLPPRAMHQFIPVDAAACVARFLDHWRPDLVLWIESEFWPNLLHGIAERKIPAALLNARLSKKSVRGWSLAKGWIAQMLGAFALCLSQTEAGQDDLRLLGARNVSFVGNLKFAALPLPDDDDARGALAEAIGQRPVWLFASSHPGEDVIALQAHKILRQDFPDILTIIAPRHPARGAAIAALADAHGLNSAQRSLGALPDAMAAVYIADTLGELGVFYRLCPVCCVGGSFVPIGGHNPVEPALLGAALCFGPMMENFIEIAAQMLAEHCAAECRDAAALSEFVRLMLHNPEICAAHTNRARLFAEAQGQTHDRVIAALKPVFEQAGMA